MHCCIQSLIKENIFSTGSSALPITENNSVTGLTEAAKLWQPVVCIQLAEAFARLKSPRAFYDSYTGKVQELSSGVLHLTEKYDNHGTISVQLQTGKFTMYHIFFSRRFYATFQCVVPESSIMTSWVSDRCHTITIDDLLLARLTIRDPSTGKQYDISTLAVVCGVEIQSNKKKARNVNTFPMSSNLWICFLGYQVT